MPKSKKSTMPNLWLPVALLAVVVVVLILEMTNTTHWFHHKKAVSGQIPVVKTSPATNQPSNTQKDIPAGGSSAGTPTSNTALIAPYGGLVSNHKPGQNGTNMKEESECITSAGATCYIKFTQGDVVKTLPSRTIDSSGATFWQWDINQAGLTSGSWKIEAVATLNGQTKTTQDPLTLEVQ